jgi:hypothetical protein
MNKEADEDKRNVEPAAPVERLVMRINQQFEDGDPAAPGDRLVTFINAGVVVAEMILHNEDNEDLEQAITIAVESGGGKVEYSSNVNNHYYA